MDKDIRVMHFAHWSRSGITSLIKTLAQSSKDSFVLLLEDDGFASYYAGIDNKICLDFNFRRFFKALRLFKKFYRQQKPDIVHVHSFTPLILSCFICVDSKLVFHIHNEYPYLTNSGLKSHVKRGILKVCFSVRDVSVVVVSNHVKVIMAEKFDKESTFVPNGIPDKGSVRSDFLEVPPQNRFYSVCRIQSQKNLATAIEIIEKLSEKNDILYHIYGEGPQKTALSEFVESKSLQNVISFKGFVNKPEDLAQDYDFYLSCSTFEGLSLSIVGALRGRNVVVMTPVGELKNYVRDGIEGVVIGFNLNDSVRRIEQMIAMPDKGLQNFQENGRQLFEKSFIETSFIRDIKEIYERILI